MPAQSASWGALQSYIGLLANQTATRCCHSRSLGWYFLQRLLSTVSVAVAVQGLGGPGSPALPRLARPCGSIDLHGHFSCIPPQREFKPFLPSQASHHMKGQILPPLFDGLLGNPQLIGQFFHLQHSVICKNSRGQADTACRLLPAPPATQQSTRGGHKHTNTHMAHRHLPTLLWGLNPLGPALPCPAPLPAWSSGTEVPAVVPAPGGCEAEQSTARPVQLP